MPTLNWMGKEKIVNHHQNVKCRVLKKQYTYNSNESNNMIIHGDNLLALKTLLIKYEEKIDIVYIDPPYNTGKKEGQWVYSDNLDDPRFKKWFGEVVGEEGEDFCRHDKWLCMMYPRLKLLHKLLKPSGVILISINDYEYANLKCICDEIFGVSNFVKNFIWYIDGHTDNQDQITTVHEYILCYAKNKDMLEINAIVDPNIPADSKILNSYAENSITKNGYKNPPTIIELPIGFPCEKEFLFKEKHENIYEFMEEVNTNKFISRELTKKYNMTYPVRLDDMLVENNKLKEPCRVFSGWMNNGKLLQFIKNDFKPIDDNGSTLRFYLSKNGVIYYRRDGRTNHYVQTVLERMGTTETNKYMLEQMGITFNYPKPVQLLEYLLSIFSKEDSIILDSFAGSGSTMHATMNLNIKGGNREFIAIEMMDYAEDNIVTRAKNIIDNVDGCSNFNFSFYELGESIFNDDGTINPNIDLVDLKRYIYYTETQQELGNEEGALLGEYNNTSYYLFYDKDESYCLNTKLLGEVKNKSEWYVIYTDTCSLSEEFMKKYNIIFKKLPRDIIKY